MIIHIKNKINPEIIKPIPSQSPLSLNEKIVIFEMKQEPITIKLFNEYFKNELSLNLISCNLFVENGCLRLLQFVRGFNPPFPCDNFTCAIAAKEGNLEILQWLRAQTSQTTFQTTFQTSYLFCKNYFRPKQCDWDEFTCAYAARNGNLKILQWARDQNPPCPWNELSCSYAIINGNFSILKWLREQNPPCPWNELTCETAARNGYFSILKWLREQNPQCPWNKTKLLKSYIINEKIKDWIKTQP